MIDVFAVIKIPDYKKSAYAIKKRKSCCGFFRLGKILEILELLDPKEKQYAYGNFCWLSLLLLNSR